MKHLWAGARKERHYWLLVVGASMLLSAGIGGIGLIMNGWPYWVCAMVIGYSAFAMMDLLTGQFTKPKPERTITHKDGSTAIVDGAGKRYRRVDATPKVGGLMGWLNERM